MALIFNDDDKNLYFVSKLFLLSYSAPINFTICHAYVLNQHICVLNRHAVRHDNNATQSVDSTHSFVIVFVIVFFQQPQLCACNLGLCLYSNKVVQHATCENHTPDCESHPQHVKITLLRVVFGLL
jgi:hypothetical protein